MSKQYPKDFLYGLHLGEHGFIPENIINELKENCLDRGMNFATIRPAKFTQVEPDYYRKWAKFCRDNKIYFVFLYTIQFAPIGKKTQFTPELVKEIKDIAGEYFIGDMLGETGSVWLGKEAGYFVPGHADRLPQDAPDMKTAHDYYVEAVARYVEIEKEIGMDKVGIASVEGTIANVYNIEAGVDVPIAELTYAKPEPTIASLRGATKAAGIDFWGTYVPHEWYSGVYHDDTLKKKRLELQYKYHYMQGSRLICHESGDDGVTAYGRRYSKDSEVCLSCRNFINDFAKFIKEDKRPLADPVTKIAFVYGNHDAWTGDWGASSVWGQNLREEWGYSEPEWSWRITDEIGVKSKWYAPDVYECRGNDTSALPPYGAYDILPATATAEVMSKYDTLIYCGWNSMTEEQLQNLEKFVENGGTLLLTAAHLNTSVKRSGEYTPVRGGDLTKLFGCKICDTTFKSNLGTKFNCDSAVEGLLYPTSLNRIIDPLYTNGYVEYADIERHSGIPVGTLENSFRDTMWPGFVSLIENKLGKGTAILMTTVNYPGNNAVYPLYRFLVKELMRVGNANAKVRVIGPDSLRYTVYENGDIYLLNTDYDCSTIAEIIADGYREKVELAPVELKKVSTGLKFE